MPLDSRTTAFVFPGQGSQSIGMGKDLAAAYPAAREVFERADAVLGYALTRIMWEGPESDLKDTLHTQPALYTHSVAALRALAQLNPDLKPASVAGHSLGELSALTACGALSFVDGLNLVRRRGELMKKAGQTAPGSMAAILGLSIPVLENVCAEASREGETVQVANDNCPGQVVISGAEPAVGRAIEGAKGAGAKRAIPLAVSIAAHSPLMATIQDDWNRSVEACPIGDAAIPLLGNVHAAAITQAADLRADIMAQMQSRVRWTESVQALHAQGIQTFVEVGSGTVLLGLIKRIDGSLAGLPLGNPADFESLG
jgi:[acyl-carrier-protein] S-malonyltransferase